MVKFRDTQLELLGAFVSKDSLQLCPNVLVQGFKSVGKTYTTQKYLELLDVKHTIINCDVCITHKILLQRCLTNIIADSGHSYDLLNFMYKGLRAARTSVLCENFAYFLMLLEQFIVETGYNEHHVLVLDRFDQCCDATDELFAEFLKLREYSLIRNISVIFITSHSDPREISTLSLPHIHFGPYSQDELTTILQNSQLGRLESVSDERSRSFWFQFAKIIVDLFIDYTGSDLSLLGDLCMKLWPKFQHAVDLGRFQANEFIQIYRELKEDIFNDNVISNSVVATYAQEEAEDELSGALSDLPYHSKFILLASYLASYVEPKNDLQVFSRISSNKKKRESRPTELITRRQIDSRLLTAGFFDLERLKAILSVIYRNESKTMSTENLEFFNLYQDLTEREIAKKENELATFTLNSSVDVNTQLSTLVSLGLISRTYALDILSSKIRWKCNVNWDIIESISQEIQFPISNYVL